MDPKPHGFIRKNISKMRDQEFLDNLNPNEYTCCFYEKFARISREDYQRLVRIARKGQGL